MSKGFFARIADKGSAWMEAAKAAIGKGSGDVVEVCEGLAKRPDEKDTLKLREHNPYFRTKTGKSLLPDTMIVVVGFDHKKGSIIEYAYPEEACGRLQQRENEELMKKICFAAIPDAAHTLEVGSELDQ